MANTSEQKKVKNIYFNRTDHLSVQLPLDNRELKHATFFEPRTATGSVLFSHLTCLQTTPFILLSFFSLVETISLKIWETPLSWRAKCSLQVAVHG